MSPKTSVYKLSPRFCLLLKTLLFLLCIYIKRATALKAINHREIFGSNTEQDILYDSKFAIEGDVAIDISCPWEQLVKQKKNLPQHINQTYLKELRNEILRKIVVHWSKDDHEIHRKSGNPVLTVLDDTKDLTVKGHALLIANQEDSGYYICMPDYRRCPPEAKEYFDLGASASFQVYVQPKASQPPDIAPTISHPPTSYVVARGANITFTCNTIDTLSHTTIFWFKSCSVLKERRPNNCTEKFLGAYDQAKEDPENINKILRKHIIPKRNTDYLDYYNVSDEDVAFYGCFVKNERGVDLRLGRLDIVERFFESKPQQYATSLTDIEHDQNSINAYPASSAYSTTANRTTLFPLAAHPKISNSLPTTVAPESSYTWQYITIAIFILLPAIVVALFKIRSCKLPLTKDKKKNQSHQSSSSPIVGIVSQEDELRKHLPNGDYPDIYSARDINRACFISGHHNQGDGPLMTQSISSHVLNKEKNPSISSNSDEASSWGKSMSSSGDNSRAFYSHTSNNTSTTVPMYDHPPSTGTMQPHGTVIQGCVINPTYGFLRLDPDASDWTFPRRNLERLNKIGEGQFGEVWRYIARQKDGNESFVAVKQLKNRAGLGARERLELIAEIEIMKSVNNHPNVIKLLNYCADDYEPILLIMEYAENGKLQTYLRNCRSFKNSLSCLSESSPAVTSKELVQFSYHIAKGMEYVASKGIIHRDLASRNILVSKDKICKVADFGFARRVSDDCAYERTTANPVPVKWMAPEALVENKFTSKSDVFSLGILMWEIVTLGATPYEYLTSSEVYKKVTQGGRLQRPIHCKEEFYCIMERCWSHDPAQRPTFKELASQLEKILLSENDYIELDQYPEHAYYNILNIAEKEVVNIEPIE